MKNLLTLFFILITTVVFGQTKFVHTTSVLNINANSSFLDADGLNGNANAIIVVEYDALARTANPHPVGVWYNGSKWGVFNQDMAAMPSRITFTITWKKPDANTFLQQASAKSINNGRFVLNHPLLDNNSIASFYASQVWNPGGSGGIYNNSEITVEYDKSLARWVVKNSNGSSIPDGAAFNLLIVSDKNAGNSIINPAVNNIDPAIIKAGKGINNPPVNNTPVVNIDPAVITNAQLVVLTNTDFEDGLHQWTATGTAFNNQPVQGNTVTTDRVLRGMEYNSGGIGGDYWKGLTYPIGIKNESWIGTYENGNGDAPVGTITSWKFIANKMYLTFLLGGGKDFNKLYVELQVKKSDYEAAWGAGKSGLFGNTEDGFTRVNRITPSLNSEEMFRYFFDLNAELNNKFVGKVIRIKIVDDKTTGWGHINADDFSLRDNLNDFIAITKDGFGLYADKDKPVWGYLDSHAHPGADEAFGKNYYVGSSNTPLSTTWSNEVCTRSHTWGATLDGFTNTFDPHKFFDGGWPDMWGFPKFNGKMHQKYQVDLIKRAWQGGLKIFCALGVNNMYIATRALGHNSNGEGLDDESVLIRQTEVMKAMASTNSDWMEIAYTPSDARRIIFEGKLCVILGVENDVFGNFKSPDCNWSNRAGDRPLINITAADANEKIESKLNEYYAMGLRQILPLHYLSKPFGGTAAFNGNTFLPQMEFYNNVRVKTGVPDRIGFSLYEDFPTGPAFIGSFAGYSAYAARIQKQDEGAEISMVNADGLTPVGNILFKKLMKKGFIIDQEHASYQSKRDMFRISSENGNYPIMASHVGPQGLSFIWTGAPVRYSGSHEEKIRNFNTSTIRYVAHEMELNDESYNGIRETQGTVGVFTLSNHKRKYTGRWGDFLNDCPGSSKTVAQMYCYSLDKMNGKGVGLASDLPMVDGVSPRFGPYAAWALTTEESDLLKKDLRTTNRYAQTNGIKYDVPKRGYHEEFFKGAQVDGFEEDVWNALAATESGVSFNALPVGRVQNLAKGMAANSENEIDRWSILLGEGAWEQAAMYCLKNNVQPESITIHDEGAKREIRILYTKILPVWNLWKAKNGNNEQLRRHITGNRHWDFNLDGLAHYGMMPDLLQDLKNIGFNTLQLNPLFSSAEDYIKMWERAEAIKLLVRD